MQCRYYDDLNLLWVVSLGIRVLGRDRNLAVINPVLDDPNQVIFIAPASLLFADSFSSVSPSPGLWYWLRATISIATLIAHYSV